jgi:hypothetical protein
MAADEQCGAKAVCTDGKSCGVGYGGCFQCVAS